MVMMKTMPGRLVQVSLTADAARFVVPVPRKHAPAQQLVLVLVLAPMPVQEVLMGQEAVGKLSQLLHAHFQPWVQR